MKTRFIHLHVHTEYSLVDGLPRIKQLLAATKAKGMPAIAITDHCNLFGMVKFYRAAIDSGVKPIIGVDILLQNEQNAQQPFHMMLLCQNQQGYLNLTQLVSRSYLEGQQHGYPAIKKAWLRDANEGIIAISGGKYGDIGYFLLQDKLEEARSCLHDWQLIYPDRFYIELQRTGRELDEEYVKAAVALAEEHHIPVVATNDVRFIAADDFEAHEARVCIHEARVLNDPKRGNRYSAEQYLKTPQEMTALFSDIPEAIENTWIIGQRCNLTLKLGLVSLPNFPVPQGLSLDDYFEQQSKSGLRERLEILFGKETREDLQAYWDRLDMELKVIKRMGFQGYFLIVADFIRWSKQNRIPVGPGRGSGPGSLVAYALGITELDPIALDLLFERFLNPERASMPDFDIDFCMEGRDAVIEYVSEKYGKTSVSQIITYGSMAARGVVRDVGRVLGHPYGFVDKLAKLIPFELGMTLQKALQQDETLLQRYHNEEDVKALIDLALKLEGLPRNPGKHAGGVVIAPSVLTDFTPLYCEAGGENLVTQLDKDDVEAVGLVKFDFLGLRTLTIIDWAVQTINARSSAPVPLDIARIPMHDEKVFDLLCAGHTTAVFQLESRGMKDLIKRLQPRSFDDIVPLVALFRPGPLQSGMVDDFIDRRHGRAKVEYPHPAVELVLASTYGVILYQEQVMQIAQVLAGYTLGSADLLRRAMGKKKPEEMAKQRAVFVDGAVERQVDSDVANHIFDLMEKFAGYGFNRSHSAAYALLSYQTAWLKANYPAEYMAAVLSADMDNTDKVVRLIDDCKKMHLNILPPDINRSSYRFTVNEASEIVYGLGAIKGVGSAALENCIADRDKQGSFQSLFDFCLRVDTRKVNRRVIESLIRAGAMDCFNVHRASLMASIDTAIQQAEQRHRDIALGQNDLFAMGQTQDNWQTATRYIETNEWSDDIRLAGEKETLGLYLTGHPIDHYESELMQIVTCHIADLKPSRDQTVVVGGFVVALRTMFTKNGQRMAFLTLDDRTARIELVIFSDVFSECKDTLEKEPLLIVEGEVSIDEYTESYRITARKILTLDQARGIYAKRLLLKINEQQFNEQFVEQLKSTLQPFCGGFCPIFIRYQNEKANADLVLGNNWRLRLNQNLLESLHKLCGKDAVAIEY